MIMTQPRTKGLTPRQRNNGLLFLRPDTIVLEDYDLPVRQSLLGEPGFDGQPVQWWADVSRGGAHFSAEEDALEYRTTPQGIEFVEANNDAMKCLPGLTNQNKSYFERFHTGSFTLAIRWRTDGAPPSGDQEVILDTSGWDPSTSSPSGAGILIAIADEGDGDALYVRSTLWDSSQNTIWNLFDPDETQTAFNVSGINELWISQDAEGGYTTVQIVLNGVEIFASEGFSLDSSGTPPAELLQLGHGGADSIDMTLSGVVLDTIPNRGPDALNWINLNSYTP